MTDYQTVLNFWLGDAHLSPEHFKAQGKLWYRSSTAIDQEIKARFASLHEQATNLELESWRETAESCLALVIILDQFSRHLYRATPGAFAQDDLALEIARSCPDPKSLTLAGQVFLLHPFEHSEHLDAQEESLIRFKELIDQADSDWRPHMENTYTYAVEHHAMIAKFGRFPHRNEILGRASSEAEIDFLKRSGKTYGQKLKR